MKMKEQEGQSDAVDVHINLEGGRHIVVSVDRRVLSRNMQELGLEPGQAEWEKEARIGHTQGDLLAVWASVKEAFPKFSDLLEYLSP